MVIVLKKIRLRLLLRLTFGIFLGDYDFDYDWTVKIKIRLRLENIIDYLIDYIKKKQKDITVVYYDYYLCRLLFSEKIILIDFWFQFLKLQK